MAEGIRIGRGGFGGGVSLGGTTATAADIKAGLTAGIKEGIVEGTMQPIEGGEVTPSTAGITFPAGKYLQNDLIIKGDTSLASENIRYGYSIFGIPGGYEGNGRNAWKKSLGKNYNPYVTFDFLVNSATVLNHCPVVLNDFAPSMKWGRDLIFGKIAESQEGLRFRFGTTQTLEPTWNAFYDLYEVEQDGNEVPVAVWNVLSDGTEMITFYGMGVLINPIPFRITFDTIYDTAFQEFVLSHDSAKYPESGTHTDGYYYEKITP